MNNNSNLKNNDELGDEIDIKALFKSLLINKHLIAASTANAPVQA